jgi:transposase
VIDLDLHERGKTLRQGRITKRGRKELRWILVEAARRAVRKDAYWLGKHERLIRRKHPNEAIVAIGRKLLVVVWHVLNKQDAVNTLRQVKRCGALALLDEVRVRCTGE